MTEPDLPRSALRVHRAALELGLDIEIATMPDSTRTAEEAAAACGCAVGQIVKSLVFTSSGHDTPLLFLVSGANRLDETRVAEAIGGRLERPDARFVRNETGFAIGGIPPIGHERRLETYMDRDLLSHDVVWAAAGTPRTVFPVSPDRLREVTAAFVLDVR